MTTLNTQVEVTTGKERQHWIVFPMVLTCLVLAMWGFPKVWYTQTDPKGGAFWLSESREVPGCLFVEVPVNKSAEALLTADYVSNGEFKNEQGRLIRAFSAKRYRESLNETGLFVHTPDRCWTQAGWKMEPTEPDHIEFDLHGIRLVLERRIFYSGAGRELVYFGGLVGGQPLPYRLDHNLSVALKFAQRNLKGPQGASLRASDTRYWSRVWDSFINRRALIGPKQFIRVSAPIEGEEIVEADRLLVNFLKNWLTPTPYDRELFTQAAKIGSPHERNSSR